MMYGHEKSDPVVVAVKPANKAARSATEPSVKEPAAAESVERRAGTEGNADQQSTCRTQSWSGVSQAPERIRKSADRFAVNTRGGSRMRESRTYGSVRGARGNSRPYREPQHVATCSGLQLCGAEFWFGREGKPPLPDRL